MKKKVFSKPFTQQEAIPDAGIEAAVEVLRSGRMDNLRAAILRAQLPGLKHSCARWNAATGHCITGSRKTRKFSSRHGPSRKPMSAVHCSFASNNSSRTRWPHLFPPARLVVWN